MISFLRITGFFFILFSLVIFFFPLVLIRPFRTKNSYILFVTLRKFSYWFLRIKIQVEGYEKLLKNRPSVMVANHQHTYDILTVGGIYTPFLIALGKFEIIFLPIIGLYYYLGGNLLIKRKNQVEARKAMKVVENKLKDDKLSVLIFPEGHRNPLPQLTSFKKGAFRTAINSGLPIIPIAISQYSHLENFNKLGVVNIYIKVLDPIKTSELKLSQIDELLNQSRDLMIRTVEELNQKYQ